jgi:predicted TIM-barrel fold metal-dependent hydrolase
MKRKPASFDKSKVDNLVLSRYAVKRAMERLKEAAGLFRSAAWCEKHRDRFPPDAWRKPNTNAETARTLVDRAAKEIDLANFLLDENKTARAYCPDR